MSNSTNVNNLGNSEKVAKTIVKGAGFAFAGVLAARAIEYFSRIIIARYLGVHGYGIINLAAAIMVLVGTISLCGLNGGIVRFISYYLSQGDLRKVKSSIHSGLQIIVPLSIVFSVILFLLAEKVAIDIFKDQQLTSVLKIFAASIPFFCFSSFYASVFRGFKEIKYMVFTASIFKLGIRFLLLMCFIILGFNLFGISLIYFISLVFTSVISVLIFKRIIKSYREWGGTKYQSAKKELFFFSYPLMLSLIFGTMRGKTDTIIIGYFITATHVGLYSAAMPIARLLQIGLNSINSIFMPSISEMFAKGDLQELNNTYRRVARWTFYVTLPVFLVFVFHSKHILTGFFGIEYQKAWLTLSLLLVGTFINTSSGSFGETLIAIGQTKINMLLILIYAVTNIILDIVLIPRIGLLGAAIANTFSLIVVCAFGLFYLYKFLKLQPLSIEHVKFCLISSSCFIVFYCSNYYILKQFNILFLSVFTIVLYVLSFLGFYLCKGFDSIDIMVIKACLKKLHLTKVKNGDA